MTETNGLAAASRVLLFGVFLVISTVAFAQDGGSIPGGTPLPANVLTSDATTPLPPHQRFQYGNEYFLYDFAPVVVDGVTQYPFLDRHILATGDLNGDGIDDLIVGGPYGNVTRNALLFVQFGRHLSVPTPAIQVQLATTALDAVALGRFDNDQFADLIISGAGVVSFAHGRGDGTFDPPQAIETRSQGIPKIGVADINGDGKLDLLLPVQDAGKVVIRRGNGDGTFQAATEISVPGSTHLVDAEDADVNGDHRVDLVTFDANTQTLFVYLQDASGGFALAQQVATSNNLTITGDDIDTGDFNGDGFADVAVTTLESAGVAFYFGSPQGLSVPLFGNGQAEGAYSLAVADFDGDGRADAITGDGHSAIYIYRIPLHRYVEFPRDDAGNGDVLGGGNLCNCHVAVGDLNGDGQPDEATLGATGMTLLLSGHVDTTPAHLTVPDSFTVEPGSEVTFTTSAHDDLFGDLMVFCNQSSPFIAELGENLVDCYAVNPAGDPSDASFTVTGAYATAFAPITTFGSATVGDTLAVFTALTRTGTPDDPAVVNVPVTFTMTNGATTESATVFTDAIGRATNNFHPSARGEYTVTADYAGTNGNAAATRSISIGVFQKTQLTLNQPATARPNQDVQVSATLTAIPGGAPIAGQTVGFSFDAGVEPRTMTAVTNAAGVATVTVRFPVTGGYRNSAIFLNAAGYFANRDGDAGAGETSAAIINVVNTPPTFTPPANITVTATSAAGAAVTFTANGQDAEQGTIAAQCSPASGSTFPIGTTTVHCTVTDAEGATAGGAFTVKVTAPTVTTLTAMLQALNLPGGTLNSLMAKLNAASQSLEKGQINAARNQLGAFQNEVSAQTGKKIPAAAAAQLIAMAQLAAQYL